MKNDEYISIPDYASIKGISTQAVYKQLSTKLSTAVVEVANQKKCLNKAVLMDLGLLDSNQVVNQVTNQKTKVTNQVTNQNDSKYIDILTEQLREKDKQIDKLNKQIEKQGNEIDKLLELLSEEQKTNQAQLLITAQTKQIAISGAEESKRLSLGEWLHKVFDKGADKSVENAETETDKEQQT